jgi:hypothetical protein
MYDGVDAAVFSPLAKADRTMLADALAFRFNPYHLVDGDVDELRRAERGQHALYASWHACGQKLQLLLHMTHRSDELLTDFGEPGPIPGVYVFSENETHLYAGKAKDLKSRYLGHTRPGPNYQKGCSFAWSLALEQWHAKYGDTIKLARNNRVDLLRYPIFKEMLDQQLARVKEMSFRWIEEGDTAQRDLLEFYCALVLNTSYGRYRRKPTSGDEPPLRRIANELSAT